MIYLSFFSYKRAWECLLLRCWGIKLGVFMCSLGTGKDEIRLLKNIQVCV